jgi:hypothetical protein
VIGVAHRLYVALVTIPECRKPRLAFQAPKLGSERGLAAISSVPLPPQLHADQTRTEEPEQRGRVRDGAKDPVLHLDHFDRVLMAFGN